MAWESSNTAQHRPTITALAHWRWQRNLARRHWLTIKQAGHSRTELVFSLLFDELGVLLSRLFIQSAGRGSGWKGRQSTLPFSLAARRPALFNPSSQNTGSLDQDPAVFSARLMYSRKFGWFAKPPGTGSHLASGSHWVIACTVLLWDWTYPMIGTGIKELTSGEGINTDLKSQNTVTKWTAWGLL